MDTKLQLRIQRYGWDAATAVYESAWRELLEGPQKTLIELSSLTPGLDVIETAAGTGLATFRIAESVGEKGSVLATDISAEMVARGRETAKQLGLNNVIFERQNADSLSCEDNSFDRALCIFGLMYFPQPEQALSEMKRMLRHNGRIAVAGWGQRAKCGWADVFSIVDS